MADDIVRKGKKVGRTLLQHLAGVLVGTLGVMTGLAEMFRDAPDDQIRKILVIRLDLLGDVVLSMPAVRALKESYPEARIDMLVLPYTVPLVGLYPEVSGVLGFDINKLRPSGEMTNPGQWVKFARFLSGLRRENYDLCVSLHGHPASAIALLSGARLRVGYRGDSYPFCQNVPVPGKRYRVKKHEAEYSLDLVKAVGVKVDDTALVISPRTEDVQHMERVLSDERRGRTGPVVGVHLGAANGAAKRWLLDRWATLADRLIVEKNALVVFTGSESELSLVQEVVLGMRNIPVVMTGKTSIPELVALLSLCNVVVSGDSGPMHIAVALGVPTVAIHGPTDPMLSGPYGGNAIVLRSEIDCSPCYDLSDSADCPEGLPECMERVTVGDVFSAIEGILSRTAVNLRDHLSMNHPSN